MFLAVDFEELAAKLAKTHVLAIVLDIQVALGAAGAIVTSVGPAVLRTLHLVVEEGVVVTEVVVHVGVVVTATILFLEAGRRFSCLTLFFTRTIVLTVGQLGLLHLMVRSED